MHTHGIIKEIGNGLLSAIGWFAMLTSENSLHLISGAITWLTGIALTCMMFLYYYSMWKKNKAEKD